MTVRVFVAHPVEGGMLQENSVLRLNHNRRKNINFYLKMASDVSRDGSENKRKLEEDEDEDEWVGPMPSEATQTKKKKGNVPLFF